MTTPSFKEDHSSQIPALQLLMKMGYYYLTPEVALKMRKGKKGNVILEEILEAHLPKFNTITFKGKEYPFSHHSIHQAIESLKNIPYDGLVRTSEKIYDLLCLGKSFEETLGGDTRSFNIRYIDWQNPENNVYHVTAEFEVERKGSYQTYRPDIVLFVNGIPFVVIECKRHDMKDPMREAISQMMRNQQEDGIPGLFIYSQILMALNQNEGKYGATGTPDKFWAGWREEESIENRVFDLINRPLSESKKNQLFSHDFGYARNYFEEREREGELQVTEQDRILFSLAQPLRLMEIAYRFILCDNGEKKIARYQQYFTVKETISRVTTLDDRGKRQGGVIWHTQGSGKSLTMVMLAKSLALEPSIPNPRIVLVTDRVSLDDQIFNTFKQCGKSPVQAQTGKHLIELVESEREAIITTIIDKFDGALNNREFKNESINIFVLVDESHRSQYGITHNRMRRVLPGACFIGFTGTPILKKDKNTLERFGGFIGSPYTINQAVRDKAVVPLLYEGRHALQDVRDDEIDTWFKRVCKPLSKEQKRLLKQKYSSKRQLNKTDQKIYTIAYDISLHFKELFQGGMFKGQLATDSQKDALKFKKYLDEFGLVTSEVLISSPDLRKGYSDVYEGPKEVVTFWKGILEKYGSEKEYNKQLINHFKKRDHPEIIIVVDKLLTGFDAPRNTVLYIYKNLQDHGLLQAIARVNRLFEGKEFGYIIDYWGLLGKLDQALSTYEALSGYDEEDLEGTLTDIREEVGSLPQKHSDLWEIFKTLPNKKDLEAYERHLEDEEFRHRFYTRLSAYARALRIALSSVEFLEKTSDGKIKQYKDDLKFFMSLREAVKRRYAEIIDFKEYESKVQNLLDKYVGSKEVEKITDLVNIFDQEKFAEEVAMVTGARAKADMIAHRTAKTISEKMEDDPVYYKKFSELLNQTIFQVREERLTEADYLSQVQDIMNQVRTRTGDRIPSKLKNKEVAKAFYGVVREILKSHLEETPELKDLSAEIAFKIDEILLEKRVVEWTLKPDIQNQMINRIEDYLYEMKEKKALDLSFEAMDLIMAKCMKIAKLRYENS